ncbi:MAG TPA: hypothetical protein VEL70_04190 [Candidatus Acidoferrum sp.]|nr:hypothetical protein [Candidatus Acidoferrum sp.]
MKISQLCKMIEDSIHGGKYPLEDQQKRFANSLQVISRSDSDDLKSSEIKIEVRIQGLYIISNYVPNIEHLPGIIEVDVLDSFKILCRRLGRMTDNAGNDNNNPKGATISTEKLHPPR